MFIHRIKKMPFDEAFAEYQRCLIASSVANTYEEAIKEWEVIDLVYHPDKDLISFSNRIRSHTGCTIRNIHTKITLGPFSQSGLKKLGNKDFKHQAALLSRLIHFRRDYNLDQKVSISKEYFSSYGFKLALEQKFLTQEEYEDADRLFRMNFTQYTEADHELHFKLMKDHLIPFVKHYFKQRKAKLKDSIPFSETKIETST